MVPQSSGEYSCGSRVRGLGPTHTSRTMPPPPPTPQSSTASDRLHLGCGLVTPEDWLNVDGSWNARLARYPIIYKPFMSLTGRKSVYEGKGGIFPHNVRKPLPWPEHTFTAVYASHLLEHLYLDESDRLLRECLRVLKPGGVVWVVVPDLGALLEGYRSGMFPKWLDSYPRYPARADMLVQGLLMREHVAPKTRGAYRVFQALTDFHSHKWMYDADSIAAHVRAAGFVGVKNMACWESRIPGIDRIERRDRVEEGAGIVAEGVKPGA
jgi:predicted SAM-dependent methyltransferase